MFSIAIPILLVELMFPDRRGESWVSTRKLVVLGALFVAVCAFGFLFLTPYRPPAVPYLGAALVVIALLVAARRLPPPHLVPAATGVKRPRWFGVFGFLATVGLFAIGWGLPNTHLHPALMMLLMAAFAGVVGWLAWRMTGRGAGCSDLHRLALASGALAFFIVLAPLSELDKTRPDNTTGMAIVGLAAAIMLLWLAGRIRRAQPPGKPAPGGEWDHAAEGVALEGRP